MKALQPQDASRIQLEHAAHLSEIGKVSIVLLKYVIPFRMGDHRIVTAQDTVLKEVPDMIIIRHMIKLAQNIFAVCEGHYPALRKVFRYLTVRVIFAACIKRDPKL